jgi:hypothetical protein
VSLQATDVIEGAGVSSTTGRAACALKYHTVEQRGVPTSCAEHCCLMMR